jgi:histidine triad (HIT) family protein
MADAGCIFCMILAGEIPASIVDEDERTIAFMDINPATRGHALVIPRAHSADLMSIGAEDLTATALGAQRLARRVKERLGADGVNLVNSCGALAWQSVFHFHIHVIPRYQGDPLQLPWVPAPGDPAEIAAAAQELQGA